MTAPQNAHLVVDTSGLVANWRTFAAASGSADCGAAIKANGYGLGARPVADALTNAGCRDLFVAHWHEVPPLESLPSDVRIAVLHGAGPAEMPAARVSRAVPVLNTAAQVSAWKTTGRACDVMVDTGMNRLGLSPDEALSGLLDGLDLHTLHSHLACGDVPGHPLNEIQRSLFAELAAKIPARRHALANSGGVTLGPGYCFSLTRPGIGLYGGGAAPPGASLMPVASLAARILQLRRVTVGGAIGYGADYIASREMRIAIAALGYADGYPRALSNAGGAFVGGRFCPGVGRISMDLSAFDVTDADPALLAEDSFLDIDFNLARTALASGRTEYELLTGLGARYARHYR